MSDPTPTSTSRIDSAEPAAADFASVAGAGFAPDAAGSSAAGDPPPAAAASTAAVASAATEGSYLVPRFEHARVGDAMRHGVLGCAPSDSLRSVAQTMALQHIHTVVVVSDEGRMEGILSDRDLLAALLEPDGARRAAREVAERNVETISSAETLMNAAALMRRRGVGHLVVVDAHSGIPSGMLSALDIAGILAWGEV